MLLRRRDRELTAALGAYQFADHENASVTPARRE